MRYLAWAAIGMVSTGCGRKDHQPQPLANRAVVAEARTERAAQRPRDPETWANADAVALRYCPGDRELIALDGRGVLRRFRASDGVELATAELGRAHGASAVIDCNADGVALARGSGDAPMLIDAHGAITRPPHPIAAIAARFAPDGAVIALTAREGTLRWSGGDVSVATPSASPPVPIALADRGALVQSSADAAWLAPNGGVPIKLPIAVTKGAAANNDAAPAQLAAALAPDGAVLVSDGQRAYAWEPRGSGYAPRAQVLATADHIPAIAATAHWFAEVDATGTIWLESRALDQGATRTDRSQDRHLDHPCGPAAVAAIAFTSDDAHLAIACPHSGVHVVDL